MEALVGDQGVGRRAIENIRSRDDALRKAVIAAYDTDTWNWLSRHIESLAMARSGAIRYEAIIPNRYREVLASHADSINRFVDRVTGILNSIARSRRLDPRR